MIIKRNKEFSKKTPIIDDYYKKVLTRDQAAYDRSEAKREGKFRIRPYLENAGWDSNSAFKVELDDIGSTDEDLLRKAKKGGKRAGRIAGGTLGGILGAGLGSMVGIRKTNKLNKKAGAIGALAAGGLGSLAMGKYLGKEAQKKLKGPLEERRKESRAAFGKKSSV